MCDRNGYAWCVVCGVWCVVCGVWCVVCGVWCVVCGVEWTQVALPVGQEIKYKYVVRSGKDWRWELGFDRTLQTEANVRQLVEIRDVIRSNGSLPPSLPPSLTPSLPSSLPPSLH